MIRNSSSDEETKMIHCFLFEAVAQTRSLSITWISQAH
jgi:hypothetical protein